MFRYNQTPSGSFIGGAAQPVRLREAVKHGLLFFLRNTDSGIAYDKEEIKTVVGFFISQGRTGGYCIAVHFYDDFALLDGYIDGPSGDVRLRADAGATVPLAALPGWAWAPVDQRTKEGDAYPGCPRTFARRMADAAAEKRIVALIDECKQAGDTLGGVVETVVTGLPPGLGSHAQWDRKLDARLAFALMSVQATKGVEVGLGFEMARRRGSQVHDEIFFDPEKMVSEGTPRIVPTGFYRGSNNSGGTEGGMTNGAPLVVRVAMKPISTLMSPLQSVDLRTKQSADASVERSDVCAAPAAAVVGESVVAFELANALLDKFGGDSLREIKRNYESYLEQIKAY